MSKSIEIRDFEKKDINSLLRMTNPEFVVKKDFRYMIWQCFENPLPTIIKIAFHKREIIGLFGVQERVLSNGLRSGQLSYLFVSPYWRGKGVFRLLGRAAIDSARALDVILVFSNDAAVKGCQNSFDMKYISSINMLKYRPGHQIELIDYNATRINSFTVYRQIDFGLQERVHFQYSPEFFRWRFALNTIYNYEKIETGNGEYAVVKCFVEPQSHKICGDIVYYRCNLNDQSSIKSLMTGCCSFLVEQQKVETVTTWAPNHEPLLNVLKSVGFYEENPCSHFLVRTMRSDLQYLEDCSNWIVMQSDATNY